MGAMAQQIARPRTCLIGPIAALSVVVATGSAATDTPSARHTPWPTPIVDVETARARLAREPVTILDARARTDVLVGHISGAMHMDWTETREGTFTGGLLLVDTDALARAFASRGVDDARGVLVCGDGAKGWGEEARLAWTLRTLGHDDVAMLDGGCVAWRDAGHAWARGPTLGAREGHFTPRLRHDARATKSDVARALDDEGVVLVDARTKEEFDGATPYLEKRGGHLPRARHLDWRALYDERGRLKRGDALAKTLRALGVDEKTRVVVYCTGGVRSALVTEVMRAHGVDAKNYDGSMWEWAADETLPLVVDDAAAAGAPRTNAHQ